MCGHFAPDVGRFMEDDFINLLENLGYRIALKRDVQSGIDIIAKFAGEPLPKPMRKCRFLKPVFSPNCDYIAFSLKRGDFTDKDIQEIIDKKNAIKENKDFPVKNVDGAIIVSNLFSTEHKIDEIFRRGVFYWDVRRLIFYSTKVRSYFHYIKTGPIAEFILPDLPGTYLQITDGMESHLVKLYVEIFLDEHSPEFTLNSEITMKILTDIYKTSIKPVVDSLSVDVHVTPTFYTLGIADQKLIETSYIDYASDHSKHENVQFNPNPKIYQFGAAPWTIIYK